MFTANPEVGNGASLLNLMLGRTPNVSSLGKALVCKAVRTSAPVTPAGPLILTNYSTARTVSREVANPIMQGDVKLACVLYWVRSFSKKARAAVGSSVGMAMP